MAGTLVLEEENIESPPAALIVGLFLCLLMSTLGWACARDALRGTFRADLTLFEDGDEVAPGRTAVYLTSEAWLQR